MADNALDVQYVAQLAHLRLSADEAARFQEQLAHVIEHVAKLGEVDVRDVEVSAHASPIFNVFREDEPRDWFTAAEALRNAPRQAHDLFVVTKVVG